jgi:exodeoxyribonuclease VII small subunit
LANKKNTLDFEAALTELEQLVALLEKGDLSLEDSLKKFEQGVKLTRNCQKALLEAEQKVQLLIEKNGELSLEPFDQD